MKLAGRQWMVGLVAAALLSMPLAAMAGDLETQGRAILEKNQKAVVTVQLVIKQKMSMGAMGSHEEESKTEATGCVIDPSGLTVMSLSETDPGSIYESMMSGMGETGENFKMESSVGDVKILLDDGTEVPGQVVLRDKDLDLAFVRPTEAPAAPFTAVDLGQAAQPELLDQVITVNRLGKVANRSYAVGIERIQSIVRKPRTLYIAGKDPTHTGLGSPVFALDGKLVGICALRTAKGASGGGFMSAMSGIADSMLPVIVPVADVQDSAKQAPKEAPKEEPKVESKEESKPDAAAAPESKS